MGRRIYRRSSLCLRHSWPHRSGPRKGPFFYGLGGPPLWDRQKASELEKGPDHIPGATKMVVNFTFPFGILFSLALAAVIGPVESITSFPPVGLLMSRLQKQVRVKQHRGCLITSQAANSPRICKGYASRLWRPLQIHRMNGAICT